MISSSILLAEYDVVQALCFRQCSSDSLAAGDSLLDVISPDRGEIGGAPERIDAAEIGYLRDQARPLILDMTGAPRSGPVEIEPW